MEQSLAITTDVYVLAHEKLWDTFSRRRWASKTAVGVFDLVTTLILPMPLTDAWLHEEWHRAVLGRRGIANPERSEGYKPQYLNFLDSNLIRIDAFHDVNITAAHLTSARTSSFSATR